MQCLKSLRPACFSSELALQQIEGLVQKNVLAGASGLFFYKGPS